MFERVTRWLHRHDQTIAPISIEADSFWYPVKDGNICQIRWSDILEIRAYKLDLLTVDEVRFSFQMNGWWADVSEEQPGFTQLIRELELRFPSVVGWQDKIILPPFVRNETILYQVPSMCQVTLTPPLL